MLRVILTVLGVAAAGAALAKQPVEKRRPMMAVAFQFVAQASACQFDIDTAKLLSFARSNGLDNYIPPTPGSSQDVVATRQKGGMSEAELCLYVYSMFGPKGSVAPGVIAE